MTVYYHNPRCTKSKQAFAMLTERGLDFETRLYLEQPLTTKEILDLFEGYDGDIKDFVRDKESQEAGFSFQADPNAMAVLLVQFPKALQRPILYKDGKTVIGRPAELVLDLL